MKRRIPIALLEQVEPLIQDNLELIHIQTNPNVLFRLEERDQESNFFYEVVRQEAVNGKLGYIYQALPHGRHKMTSGRTWVKYDLVAPSIEEWIKLIKSYHALTVFDDPITKKNEERFAKQFEILDKDAAYSTFELTQQLYLESYLDECATIIRRLKARSSEEEVRELASLEDEVLEIKKHLTTETKKQIIKRLSKLWAKAQKIGLHVIKEIFVNVASDLTTKLLSGEMIIKL